METGAGLVALGVLIIILNIPFLIAGANGSPGPLMWSPLVCLGGMIVFLVGAAKLINEEKE